MHKTILTLSVPSTGSAAFYKKEKKEEKRKEGGRQFYVIRSLPYHLDHDGASWAAGSF